jgi:hypothetical protein
VAASGAATSADQAAASPVAAVIMLSSLSDAVPATANPAGSSAAIGEQTKARAQAKLSRIAGQDHQPATTSVDGNAEATADAASAQQTSAGNGASDADAAESGSPASAGPAGSAQSPSNAQQAQADNAAFTAPLPDANVQASADIVAARSTAGSASAADSSSNAQASSNAVKAAGSDLPNLAIAAAGTATAQAVATPGTPTASGVAVSGLPIVIAAHAQAGSNQFDIRLDPPELGRIDVQLNVDNNGQVTSHITVDRPETLTLLQSQQPQLERALEQAGLKTADNGLQFTLRDQSFAGQSGGNDSGAQQAAAQQLVIPDADLSPIDTTQIYSRLNLGGGIDIRV